jgi:hypothetical protein
LTPKSTDHSLPTTSNERFEIWRISEGLTGFAQLDFEIAHKKGLQPTMTVDGRPILFYWCKFSGRRWHSGSRLRQEPFVRGLSGQGAVRPVVIVVILPFFQLLVEEVDVVRDSVAVEELVVVSDKVDHCASLGKRTHGGW